MTAKNILAILAVLVIIAGCAPNAYHSPRSYKEIKMEGIERQAYDYSCGAASLSLLLTGYYRESKGELLLLTDILARLNAEEIKDRVESGFSLLDLKLAANRYGYAAVGIKLPADSLPKIHRPVIVLLNKANLNHFIVLKGTIGNKVFIADPIQGNISMRIEKFLTMWDGTALVLDKENFTLPDDYPLAITSEDMLAPEKSARVNRYNIFTHRRFIF